MDEVRLRLRKQPPASSYKTTGLLDICKFMERPLEVDRRQLGFAIEIRHLVALVWHRRDPSGHMMWIKCRNIAMS